MSMALRYSRQVYQNKFDELDGYNKQLSDHLDTLEDLRDQIKNYWDDDIAQGYFENLTTQILKVRQVMHNIDGMKNLYSKTIGEMDAQKNAGFEVIDDIKDLVTGIAFGDK